MGTGTGGSIAVDVAAAAVGVGNEMRRGREWLVAADFAAAESNWCRLRLRVGFGFGMRNGRGCSVAVVGAAAGTVFVVVVVVVVVAVAAAAAVMVVVVVLVEHQGVRRSWCSRPHRGDDHLGSPASFWSCSRSPSSTRSGEKDLFYNVT